VDEKPSEIGGISPARKSAMFGMMHLTNHHTHGKIRHEKFSGIRGIKPCKFEDLSNKKFDWDERTTVKHWIHQ
jgi:hypothetical protein